MNLNYRPKFKLKLGSNSMRNLDISTNAACYNLLKLKQPE